MISAAIKRRVYIWCSRINNFVHARASFFSEIYETVGSSMAIHDIGAINWEFFL